MGLGDEIMALGRCEAYHEATGKPAAIFDIAGRPREHVAWVGNPAWDKNAEHKILDAPGHRGYIKRWNGSQIIFNQDYKARAGKMYDLPPPLLDDDFILIAPHIKENASPNKLWPFARWCELARRLPGKLVQIGPGGEQVIPGAQYVVTKDFRQAAAMIKRARLVVCQEGGTHHMAASVGTPAVVIFGSFVSPEITGYEEHCNISVVTNHGFCGNFGLCDECQRALLAISVDEMAEAVREMLYEA